MLVKARGPRWAIVNIVFSRIIRSRIFSKDHRNIQLCIVINEFQPEAFANENPRSMKHAKRSPFVSGKPSLVNFLSLGFIPPDPIYGGLATTT